MLFIFVQYVQIGGYSVNGGEMEIASDLNKQEKQNPSSTKNLVGFYTKTAKVLPK